MKTAGERIAKVGDRFIRPDNGKVYVVTKLVLQDGWVILTEESESVQTLTSQESLLTWIKCEENKVQRLRPAK